MAAGVRRQAVSIYQNAPDVVVVRGEGVQNRFVAGVSGPLKTVHRVEPVRAWVEPERVVFRPDQVFSIALRVKPVDNLTQRIE